MNKLIILPLMCTIGFATEIEFKSDHFDETAFKKWYYASVEESAKSFKSCMLDKKIKTVKTINHCNDVVNLSGVERSTKLLEISESKDNIPTIDNPLISDDAKKSEVNKIDLYMTQLKDCMHNQHIDVTAVNQLNVTCKDYFKVK